MERDVKKEVEEFTFSLREEDRAPPSLQKTRAGTLGNRSRRTLAKFQQGTQTLNPEDKGSVSGGSPSSRRRCK
jgi:hypothetical protein